MYCLTARLKGFFMLQQSYCLLHRDIISLYLYRMCWHIYVTLVIKMIILINVSTPVQPLQPEEEFVMQFGKRKLPSGEVCDQDRFSSSKRILLSRAIIYLRHSAAFSPIMYICGSKVACKRLTNGGSVKWRELLEGEECLGHC